MTAVAIGRAGDRDVIVSGSDDGTVRVWDAVTGDPVGDPLTGHDRPGELRWRSGGPGTATSSSPAPTTARCGSGTRSPATRSARRWPATTAAVSGGGGRAGRGPRRHRLRPADGTVRVWDAVTGDPAGDPLTGHTGPVNAVAVGPGRGPGRHRLRLRRRHGAGLGRGHRRTRSATRWPATPSRVNAVAIGRAGDRDVIVSGPTTARCGSGTRSPASRSATRWPATTGPVTAVAIGRAGDRDVIVSGCDDGTVRVWDAATGQPAGDAADRPQRPGEPRWRSGGPGTARSSSPAPTTARCGSGTRSPATRSASPLAGHDRPVTRGGDRAGRGPRRDRLRPDDGTVRVWDAVTGAAGRRRRWPATTGSVDAVAIGRAGGPRRHRLRLRRWHGAGLGRGHRRSPVGAPAGRPRPAG